MFGVVRLQIVTFDDDAEDANVTTKDVEVDDIIDDDDVKCIDDTWYGEDSWWIKKMEDVNEDE